MCQWMSQKLSTNFQEIWVTLKPWERVETKRPFWGANCTWYVAPNTGCVSRTQYDFFTPQMGLIVKIHSLEVFLHPKQLSEQLLAPDTAQDSFSHLIRIRAASCTHYGSRQLFCTWYGLEQLLAPNTTWNSFSHLVWLGAAFRTQYDLKQLFAPCMALGSFSHLLWPGTASCTQSGAKIRIRCEAISGAKNHIGCEAISGAKIHIRC